MKGRVGLIIVVLSFFAGFALASDQQNVTEQQGISSAPARTPDQVAQPDAGQEHVDNLRKGESVVTDFLKDKRPKTVSAQAKATLEEMLSRMPQAEDTKVEEIVPGWSKTFSDDNSSVNLSYQSNQRLGTETITKSETVFDDYSKSSVTTYTINSQGNVTVETVPQQQYYYGPDYMDGHTGQADAARAPASAPAAGSAGKESQIAGGGTRPGAAEILRGKGAPYGVVQPQAYPAAPKEAAVSGLPSKASPAVELKTEEAGSAEVPAAAKDSAEDSKALGTKASKSKVSKTKAAEGITEKGEEAGKEQIAVKEKKAAQKPEEEALVPPERKFKEYKELIQKTWDAITNWWKGKKKGKS